MTDAIDRGVDRALRRLASMKIKKSLGPVSLCECGKTAWAASDIWAALVDAGDEPVLSMGWSVSMRGTDPACLSMRIGSVTERLHRLMLGVPPDYVVDHANGNPLDNRRVNLRVCTAAQNNRNRRPQRGTYSGYRGVHLHRDGRWRADIWADGVKHYLGLHDTAEAAAAAYDEAAVRLHGEFARPNKPPTSSV
jgi:hypothetical protein